MDAIQIVPYNPEWPHEFAACAALLRTQLHPYCTRIDHIGSTSVPGLAAKDILDIQIAVPDFSPALVQKLLALGYLHRPDITGDHCPASIHFEPASWQKQFFKTPAGARPMNIHIRRDGAENQRYALLFRDYLRTHATAAAAYAKVKLALAQRHPDDWDFYYAVKDPVCDIVWEAALAWAGQTGWQA